MMRKRVCVYIDGANFYYGLKTIDKRYSDIFFDFEKYIKKITNNNDLINIYYYNAPLKENLNKLVYWNQVRFFTRLKKISKCNVVLCKRQRRIDKEKKEYFVIKGDDIHLALDMLRDACKDKYDKAVLISGDGDFTSLVKYVKEEGKEVEVQSFKDLTATSLINEADRYFWIDKKTVNRFFFRSKKH